MVVRVDNVAGAAWAVVVGHQHWRSMNAPTAILSSFAQPCSYPLFGLTQARKEFIWNSVCGKFYV